MGIPSNTLPLHHTHIPGPRNQITDVPGLAVGHSTINDHDIHTGVTAILPHRQNLFREKIPAAVHVINGFGKSMGLIQIEELGTIETPILMTNTLSTGCAHEALTRYMLDQNPEIGVTCGTVNAVITECNDGRLNDIRGMHVKEHHIREALANVDTDFAEGSIGGGTGMVCMGLKGGIGSASRMIDIEGKTYTIGALVMTNFGKPGSLVIDGKHYDTRQIPWESDSNHPSPMQSHSKNQEKALDKDQGSIIIILATDLPLSCRQLKRIAKRSAFGLARTGSYCGNGSGDIAIAFSTAYRIPQTPEKTLIPIQILHDDLLDPVFEATVESVEEAIISSLYHSETMHGIRGNRYMGLQEYLSHITGKPDRDMK